MFSVLCRQVKYDNAEEFCKSKPRAVDAIIVKRNYMDGVVDTDEEAMQLIPTIVIHETSA